MGISGWRMKVDETMESWGKSKEALLPCLETVQEMCGFQLCIARMDEEMIKYWQAPCKTPYHTV